MLERELDLLDPEREEDEEDERPLALLPAFTPVPVPERELPVFEDEPRVEDERDDEEERVEVFGILPPKV